MKFLSQVLTAASGSIGGVTYSKNRGGMYQRARAIPSNPGTERQGIARENLATAVGLWTNTLTPAQRTSWADYAAATPFTDALGQAVQLTGQQIFVRSTAVRLLIGEAPILDGPIIPGLGNTPQWVGDPQVYEDTQIIEGEVSAEEAGAGDLAVIYMTRPCNPSKTAAHQPRRYAFVEPYVVLSTTFPVDSPTPFVVTVGQLIRVTALIIKADGRVSPEAYRDTLVLATAP